MSDNQRSPCLLVLDLPAGGKDGTDDGGAAQRALDEGLRVLRDALRAEGPAQHRVELSIIDAGGPSHDAAVVLDWAAGADFAPPQLQPGPFSHLAHAMRLALQHVEHRMLTLRRLGLIATRPWIMVLSRGILDEPVELWENVARDCREAQRQKRCVVFPIVVGERSADALQQVSATRVARMPATACPEYFRWLAQALAATSAAVPGEPVRLPPTDAWGTMVS